MKAIILAAGQGQRLRPLTDHFPKCLIPIAGAPVLEHMLHRIQRCGLQEVVLVTGFEGDRIRRQVVQMGLRDLRIEFVVNKQFAETNNLYSLWLALRDNVGPVMIFNADDYFNVHILEALKNTPADAAAVIDFTRPLPLDAMKTRVDGSRVTFLGKTLPEHFASGNAIGMYRFSARAAELLRGEISAWVSGGRTKDFYVSAISELASRVAIHAVSTEGLTWGEIDDHEDLAAAPSKFARIVAEERTLSVRVPPEPAIEQYIHFISTPAERYLWQS
jgi:L-glutamine-phosphate cytidylyltransferase